MLLLDVECLLTRWPGIGIANAVVFAPLIAQLVYDEIRPLMLHRPFEYPHQRSLIRDGFDDELLRPPLSAEAEEFRHRPFRLVPAIGRVFEEVIFPAEESDYDKRLVVLFRHPLGDLRFARRRHGIDGTDDLHLLNRRLKRVVLQPGSEKRRILRRDDPALHFAIPRRGGVSRNGVALIAAKALRGKPILPNRPLRLEFEVRRFGSEAPNPQTQPPRVV